MLRAEGDELRRLFAERGLRAEPVASATPVAPVLFLDQIDLAGVTLRRVWHTPLSLSPADADRPRTGFTLVLQAEGATRWSWRDGQTSTTTGAGGALVYPAPEFAGAVCEAASGRIEIESRHLPVRAVTPLPGADDGPAWKALASTVNAVFNNERALHPETRGPLRDAIERLCVALIAGREREGDEAASASSDTTYASAMAVIHERATHPDFSVEELATVVGISRQYLARVFARRATTPRDALRARRWEVAQGLLAAGASLSEAAARSGFPSARALAHARRAYREEVEAL